MILTKLDCSNELHGNEDQLDGGWVAEWLACRSSKIHHAAGSNLDRRSVAQPSLPPGLRWLQWGHSCMNELYMCK